MTGRARQDGRALIVALIIAAALAALWAYWYFNPHSVPWWVRVVVPVQQSTSTMLYKWRDAQGRWEYGDSPPQGVSYQEVEVDHDTNVVPGQAAPD